MPGVCDILAFASRFLFGAKVCYATRVRSPLHIALVLALFAPLGVPYACASAAPQPPSPGPAVVHAPPPDDPAHSERYRGLVISANHRLRDGAYAAGLALADEALRVLPFGIEAGVAKIEAHLALGERVPAEDFALRLAERHPDRAEAHFALGKALYALGRISEARDAFTAALARAPDDRPSLLGLLTTLVHDPEVPLAELEARADELMPDAPADALHALAMAQEIRGDASAADALYERALAARARHPFAHYNLARLRLAQRGMVAARSHFQAFLDQAPPWAAREVAEVQKLLEENARHE